MNIDLPTYHRIIQCRLEHLTHQIEKLSRNRMIREVRTLEKDKNDLLRAFQSGLDLTIVKFI